MKAARGSVKRRGGGDAPEGLFRCERLRIRSGIVVALRGDARTVDADDTMHIGAFRFDRDNIARGSANGTASS